MGNVTIETEIKCPKCKKMINRDRAAKNKYVCYECGYYFRVKTHNRIRMVADRKSFQPWFEEIEESNPLNYEGYEEKLSEAREKSGVKEAVTVGECEIYGERAVIGICESKFMMGSMGHVVGEKVTRAIEKATELRLPVFLFCCSGGARSGGNRVTDADGKDLRSDQTAWRSRTSLRDYFDGSHHRWCHGQFCHAGRCDHGGTGSRDRLRRTESH